MAVIDVLALVIIGVFAIIGAKKGFIKTIFGLVSVLVAVLLASLIGSEIGKLIASIPSAEGVSIGADLANSIHQSFADKGEIFTSVPIGGYTEGVIIDALKSAGVPTIFGSMMAGPISTALSGVSGVCLADAVAPVMSALAFSAIGFILVFIITWALVLVLGNKIKKRFESVTMLNTLDLVLGLGLGALRGMLLICIVLTLLTSLNFIPGLGEFVQNSAIVSWIANNNFITAILSSGFSVTDIVNGVISA